MKREASNIRWGILGTGASAQQFALGLANLANARLVAIGAYSQVAADAFGEANSVPRRYGAFEALAHDSDVDVVYIATPPPFHKTHIQMYLQAGKAVVCNLPLATDADAIAALITLAREQRLFLMAGMWTRFLAFSACIRGFLAEGLIGQPHLLSANIALRCTFNPLRHAHDDSTDGQTLLEAGAHFLTLASLLFGPPVHVVGKAHCGRVAGDHAAAILEHQDGQLAVLLATTPANPPQEASIIGDAGWIRVHPRWWAPQAFTLTVGRTQQVVHVPIHGNAASYMADEAMRCLQAGQLASEMMPQDEMLALARILDQMREQYNLASVDAVEPLSTYHSG